MEQDPAISTAMDLVVIVCLPMALKTAIELNVLDILAKAGPESKLSASQIVTQLPTNNPNASTTLDRILKLLASHSILSSTNSGEGERLYGLSPVCKYLLPDQDGVSLAPLIVMCHDKVHMESWHYLKDAVLEGCVPFNKAYGMSAFEYHGKDTRFSKLFNAAMFNHSTSAMRDVLENYMGFEGLKEIVDVGGGIGGFFDDDYFQGTNFDLPYVIADAPCSPGVKHVAGDMFENVPSGDAIFMKWILHDWDDERCIKVLINCWKALPDAGKVIIVEFVLPTETTSTDPISRRIISSDLVMLAMNRGKERTFQEFQALGEQSGFPVVKAFPCSHGISVIEFYKKP
ncbi:5'-desmethyl-yatein O-methyltransferase [Cinnamomum micranthum f. kanehirae]|uniref:5'-desmethyl-yatein O-methyltransferase n=1 Tax=Cinnamomum micranthum f. kanehirae TaxID=337451 RepID=A0A443PFK6_9MAGN|nr:5'-desmethyl-yatein O-methyltransferase [Cinnamomum micranthum f. kanehirae]